MNKSKLNELLLANMQSELSPGFGLDAIYPQQPFHYPEAYASFGLTAYRIGNHDVTTRCAHFLMGKNNWGLPWDWAIYGERLVPGGYGFVTTTVKCLKLLSAYGFTLDYTWLKDNAFRYGDHDNADIVVWNSLAQAAGCVNNNLLSTRLQIALKDSMYYGLWSYSIDRPFMFEEHQAMIHEGLIEADDVFDLVDTALEATWKYLFSEDGQGYEDINKAKPMYARHMALQAWCFKERGFEEISNVIVDTLRTKYIKDGIIYNVPNGFQCIRSAASVLDSLTRIYL